MVSSDEKPYFFKMPNLSTKAGHLLTKTLLTLFSDNQINSSRFTGFRQRTWFKGFTFAKGGGLLKITGGLLLKRRRAF